MSFGQRKLVVFETGHLAWIGKSDSKFSQFVGFVITFIVIIVVAANSCPLTMCCAACLTCMNFFFFKDFIYLLLERGEGREKERETNSNVLEIHWSVAAHMPPAGGLAGNPGTCLDQESTSNLSILRPAPNHWATPARSMNDFLLLSRHLCEVNTVNS